VSWVRVWASAVGKELAAGYFMTRGGWVRLPVAPATNATSTRQFERCAVSDVPVDLLRRAVYCDIPGGPEHDSASRRRRPLEFAQCFAQGAGDRLVAGHLDQHGRQPPDHRGRRAVPNHVVAPDDHPAALEWRSGDWPMGRRRDRGPGSAMGEKCHLRVLHRARAYHWGGLTCVVDAPPSTWAGCAGTGTRATSMRAPGPRRYGRFEPLRSGARERNLR